MKHFQIFVLTLIALVFVGCSNSLDDMTDIVGKSAGTVSNRQRISKEDAVDIANKVLKRNATRGESAATPAFDYVMAKNLTRSLTLPDTLAYILNYPDNSGFVIVASDKRVYPVLAYSEDGCFNSDNEIAKANFLDRIETYMEEANPDVSYEASKYDLDRCGGVYNGTGISIGQSEPWNKYLAQEYPKTPLGCVTVASALVMSYTKPIFTYHNTIFHLKPIIEAINKGQVPKYNSPKRIVNGEVPVYSYDQAVDLMAKFLYYIGKDLGIDYEYDTGADSYVAYLLFKQLGFKVSNYYKFNLNSVVNYLINNNIIYLRGGDLNSDDAHAWMSDGCTYCINPQTQEYENVFLHFNWGWYGECDGYYSGSIYIVDPAVMQPFNYFAVKKEY